MSCASANPARAIATLRDPVFLRPHAVAVRELSKKTTRIQVRANDRILVAGGTLHDPFALVAHTLGQHAIGASASFPYACSLAMAIPSHAIR